MSGPSLLIESTDSMVLNMVVAGKLKFVVIKYHAFECFLESCELLSIFFNGVESTCQTNAFNNILTEKNTK